MIFDHYRFLMDKWGDPEKVVAFLQNYGFTIQHATVNQWFRRKSIPSEHFATLLALLEMETGKPVSTAEYMQ